MKCPHKTCGKTFRQEDVLGTGVYDTLHGRFIGNNWLSVIRCPRCKSDITIKQTIKIEVFGYGDAKTPSRRVTDKIKDTG